MLRVDIDKSISKLRNAYEELNSLYHDARESGNYRNTEIHQLAMGLGSVFASSQSFKLWLTLAELLLHISSPEWPQSCLREKLLISGQRQLSEIVLLTPANSVVPLVLNQKMKI